MSGRVNPFADLKEMPAFETKPKPDKPVEREAIDAVARQHNFPSRQAPKTAKRKPRIHRTGRNTQFNAKATSETIERFYKAADAHKVTLGEMLKRGVDTIEAVEPLQQLADKRGASLAEIVKHAVDALERVGR